MFLPDTRTKGILEHLLDHSRPVSAKKIAQDLQLSSRQVRYSLKQVDAWLRPKGLCVEKTPGVGILIPATEVQRKDIQNELEEIEKIPAFLPPSSRFFNILLRLFFSNEPILIKKLSYELNTSKSTVHRDLVNVRKWLEKRDIILVGKPNYGLEISGEETKIRLAFSDLLLKAIGEEDLLGMVCMEENPQELNKVILKKYPFAAGEFLTEFYIHNVPAFSRLFNRKIGKKYSDNTCLKLALMANVCIFRINQGFHIQKSYKMSHQNGFLSIASEILKKNTNEIESSDFINEAHFLADYLDTQTDRWHLDQVMPTNSQSKGNMSAQVIADYILETASKKLHPSLLVNSELRRNIKSIFSEKKIAIDLDDTAIKDLQRRIAVRYPVVYETTENIREEIKQKFHFSMSSTAVDKMRMCLIAAVQKLQSRNEPIRVLLVCNTGAITAWLLESRIRTEFPFLEIAGKTSVIGMVQMQDFNDIDLIITTIGLEGIKIPQIKIDPLLEEQDIKKIQAVLKGFENKDVFELGMTRSDQGLIDLNDLLTKEMIQLKKKAGNWMNAVQISGMPLVDQGFVEARFIEAMKKVILKYGPYMVLWPGIALLHAHSLDGVHSVGMSLTTFTTPVPFGH